ncbi:hypothetical protein KXV92_007533, partial [Aspergillus fumigatus]
MLSTLMALYDQAANIPCTDWYGICLATLRWKVADFLRWAAGCQPPSPVRCLDMSTVSEMFLVALLLAANCLLLALSARHWGDVQRSAANLAVFNLVPLYMGLTFGLPTHLLGISRSSFAWMHRWFGRMAVAHSLLHGGSIIVRADDPILSLRRSHIALLAAASVFSIIPVTLHPIVQRHSQVAMKIHYLLAITAMAALSYHTQDRRSNCRSYLELLDLDRGEFESNITRQSSTTDDLIGSLGKRIKLHTGSIKAGEVVQHHLRKRRGKLAVGGCFHPVSNADELYTQYAPGDQFAKRFEQQSKMEFDLEPLHNWETPQQPQSMHGIYGKSYTSAHVQGSLQQQICGFINLTLTERRLKARAALWVLGHILYQSAWLAVLQIAKFGHLAESSPFCTSTA